VREHGQKHINRLGVFVRGHGSLRTLSLSVGVLIAALSLAGCFGGTGSYPVGPTTKNGIMGPGLWHSTGGDACSWSTRSFPLGGVPNPVGVGPVGSGPRYANVYPPGDHQFDTDGCALWVQAGGPFDVLHPISIYGVVLGDGDYLVGPEIPAGTYRATTPSTCHWSRVRSFRGPLQPGVPTNIFQEPIIESSSSDTVTIAPTDFGFSTYNCGAWIGIAPPPMHCAICGLPMSTDDEATATP
jgi:hypothetical protein